MRTWLYEFLVHWTVNLIVLAFPRLAQDIRLDDWEVAWQRRRWAMKARWHIQKSSPRKGELGVDSDSSKRREEALLALWRELHTYHKDHP